MSDLNEVDVELVEKILNLHELRAQSAAIAEVAGLPRERALPLLTELALRIDALTVSDAVGAIAAMPGEEANASLLKVFSEHKAGFARSVAARLFLKRAGDQFEPAVRRLFEGNNNLRKTEVVNVIDATNSFASKLLQGIADSNENIEVRFNAARKLAALGKLGGVQALQRIAASQSENDANVRHFSQQAAASLQQFKELEGRQQRASELWGALVAGKDPAAATVAHFAEVVGPDARAKSALEAVAAKVRHISIDGDTLVFEFGKDQLICELPVEEKLPAAFPKSFQKVLSLHNGMAVGDRLRINSCRNKQVFSGFTGHPVRGVEAPAKLLVPIDTASDWFAFHPTEKAPSKEKALKYVDHEGLEMVEPAEGQLGVGGVFFCQLAAQHER